MNPNIVCERLHGFHGVSVGGLATVNLNLGRRYHKIVLTGSGSTQSPFGVKEFEYVRMLLNGMEFLRYTPEQLHEINSLYANGQYDDPNSLTIYFERPWAETPALEDALCIGTGPGVQLFTLEVKIKSGLDSVPELEGYQFYDLVRQKVSENGTTYETALPPGEFLQTVHYTKEIASLSGGVYCYDVPARGLLQALHFDTNKIKEIEVYLGTTSVYHVKNKDFALINKMHDMNDSGKWTHVMLNQGRVKSGILNAEKVNFKIRVVAEEAIAPNCIVDCVVSSL